MNTAVRVAGPFATRKGAQPFPWGAVQGTVLLNDAVLRDAAALAQTHYAQAEADEFCGDAVEDYLVPGWMPEIGTWFPSAEVRALGFEQAAGERAQLLATVGVDPHVDAIHGPVFILVLHNDGLAFKQGRQRHKTKAGEWFVFLDSKEHGVQDARKTTTYLALAIPLRALC